MGIPFKTAQPWTEDERATSEPRLDEAFERFESTIARRRRRRGFHQSYLIRATPESLRKDRCKQGDRDDD